MRNQGLVPVIVLSTPDVNVGVAFLFKAFVHSGHPQFSGVHSSWAKENLVIAESFLGEVMEEGPVDWFVLNQIKVGVFFVEGVEQVNPKVGVLILDGNGPFGILGGQFVEAFNEGREPHLGGVVQGVGKAMARWKRKNAGEGSHEVVFDDCLRFGN